MIKHWRIGVFLLVLAAAVFGIAYGKPWGIGLGIVAAMIFGAVVWLRVLEPWYKGNRTKAWALWVTGLPAAALEFLRQLEAYNWTSLLEPENLIYAVVGSAFVKWIFREHTNTAPGQADDFDRR